MSGIASYETRAYETRACETRTSEIKARETGVTRPSAEALESLCAPVLASLARSDQRERGMKYVEGLLATEGRRSFRNMASCLGGGPTLEQRLHHFVSCSTWDWTPVRRALAARMATVAPPDAWVLRPMVAPKDGDHMVGVHRRYVPELGHKLKVQYAVGLWAVSGAGCYPVNWRLLLPRTWTDDTARRSRAAIPDGTRPETPTECAISAVSGPVRAGGDGGRPPKPVILADGAVDAVVAVRQLRAAGLPFLVQAGRAAARPGSGPGTGDLLLLTGAEGEPSRPGELWLTNLLDAGTERLTALTAAVRRVDEAFERITGPLGLRDFTGRTFDGWHRHVTLVSVAHAATLL